jgi:glycopeptide antibiotics resistance protein
MMHPVSVSFRPAEADRRNRLAYLLVALAVIPIGLASRSAMAAHLPHFIATYAGDTLWALLVFLLAGMLMPSGSTGRVAAAALLFSIAIEISQLYHAPWMDTIRATLPGRLVLGFTFLWSDLVCYGCGIALGVVAESIVRRFRSRRIRHA